MLSNFRFILLMSAVFCAKFLPAQPQLQLQDFATGFIRPVDIAHCGDSRLFIVEQRGIIWIVDSLGNKSAEPFLDIDARVRSVQNEQGLLGLAFDPDYATNGYFYVYYTREPDFDTHVSRFSRDPLNANKANPNSELVLLYEDQPYTNHNGGCMKFGPDGYLYIALGDGGSANDPQNYGQNKNTFLGKILRIEVGAPGQTYSVPADNPFVNAPGYKPEIWSLGWRNPWRFSFDRLTGDMWVADVGQSAREEICFEPAGTGGRNYGWRCYEGFNNFNTTGCQPPGVYTRPVFDYPNPTMGCSVTGGFVYRGQQYPDLYGYYIFTDYCSGRWWVSRRNADSTFTTQMIVDLANNQYSSLGENASGELFVASLSAGKIQRITELCSAFQLSADITPALCEGALNGIIDLNISGGTGNINFVWSANTLGQTDSMVVYLDPGEYAVTATNGNGCVRSASFTVPSENTIPTPVLNVAPGDTLPPLCAGESFVLTTQVPPPDISVKWYRDGNLIPGANSAQLNVNTPGTYSALFTDGICESELSGQTTVLVSNVAAPPQVELTAGQTDLCAGATATLSAGMPPAGSGIQWYRDGDLIPGATMTSYELGQTGSFTAQFTDGFCTSGPSNAIQVNVAAPIATPAVSVVAGQATFCPGESATLGVQMPPAGTTVQWFKDGNLISGATSATLDVDATGAYAAQFTLLGCTSDIAAPFMVTVLNAVSSPVVEISAGQPVLCSDATVTLSAQMPPSGVFVEWYRNGTLLSGADQFFLEVAEPGDYTALYTNGQCSSELSDAVVVTNAEPVDAPQISLTAGQAVLCPGAVATLSASPAPAGYTYQWYRNGAVLQGATAQEQLVAYDEVGAYSVALEGLCGPFNSSVFVVNAEAVTPFVILVNGDTLHAGVWNSYQWLLNGQPIPGATASVYVAEESGFYECQVESANGCTYVEGVQVVISQTSLPNRVNTFNLSPNPTDGLFVMRMELQQPEEFLISLTDGAQREIFRQTMNGQSVEKNIDLRGLPAGVYLLHVQFHNERFTRRVVKR